MKKQTKDRRLRMLWNSNGLWTNSGYAVEMQQLLPRLAKDGWPIAQSAFWGLDGFPVELKGYEGIKIYPRLADAWGADAMVNHAQHFGANVVFSFQDVWTLNPDMLSKLKYWVPWVPIDKDPVPPGVLNNLRYAYKIITFSRWGQKVLAKKGFTSTLILEGTDLEVFKPLDRAECRKKFGIPEGLFIFGMVAANKENPPRKGFQEAMEAFKLFHDKHPDSGLFIHSQQKAPGMFPVDGFADYLGIRQALYSLNDYQTTWLSDSKLICEEMNAFDALLHPSRTEGFGLTVVEAGACGLPVIVNNTTSMPELVVPGVTGEICETEKRGWWTSDNSYTYSADVDSLYECMERTYSAVKADQAKVAQACRDHVAENYNIDKLVKERWTPELEKLQLDILGKAE